MKVKTLEKLAEMGVAPKELGLDATQTYGHIKQENREFPGEMRDSLGRAYENTVKGTSKLKEIVTSPAYLVDTFSQMAVATGIMSYFEHNLGLKERILTRLTYGAIGLLANRGAAVAADKAKSLCGVTEESSGFKEAVYMGVTLVLSTAIYAGITTAATMIAGGDKADIIKNLMETAGPSALLTWFQLGCVVPAARKLFGTTPKTKTPTLEDMSSETELPATSPATEAYATPETATELV